MNLINILLGIFILISISLPILIWLFFWIRENKDNNPEPKNFILKTFIIGNITALLSLFIQGLLLKYGIVYKNDDSGLFLFALIEEVVKFTLIYFIILNNSKYIDEREDPMFYMIIGALGFATVENFLFLFDYFINYDFIKSMIVGSYRFIGATMVHFISSAFVGFGYSLTFFKKKTYRNIVIIITLVIASLMHWLFNFLVTSEKIFYRIW